MNVIEILKDLLGIYKYKCHLPLKNEIHHKLQKCSNYFSLMSFKEFEHYSTIIFDVILTGHLLYPRL
jgi:hypothetical protein